MDVKVKEVGVILFCEMGLDFGIGIYLIINLLSGFVIVVFLEIYVNVVFFFYFFFYDNLFRVFVKCFVLFCRLFDGDENDRFGIYERGLCVVFCFVLWRFFSFRSCK